MKIILFGHGGSDNRGSEAIIRCTSQMLLRNQITDKIVLFSSHPEEDINAGLDKYMNIDRCPLRSVPELPITLRAVSKLYNSLFHSEKLYYLLTEMPFHRYEFKNTVALATGGDGYCYIGGEKQLAARNYDVKKNGGISVLWGCSVEPDLLKRDGVIEDMKRYDLITARESITYDALVQAGVENVKFYPDPAFTLDYKESSFSENMGTNIVGINMSTYALGKDEIGLKNYVNLVNWILKNTDMDICLIPHVFKAHSNDLATNKRLYDAINDKSRINMIYEKLTAEELKAVIRKCRFYVGARTHSTIAAYSSCVPTLVVGYSVKANGIAKDIFGTYDNYVVSIHDVKSEYELSHSFAWMYEHEVDIRNHLEKMMPDYIQRAYKAGEEIQKFI